MRVDVWMVHVWRSAIFNTVVSRKAHARETTFAGFGPVEGLAPILTLYLALHRIEALTLHVNVVNGHRSFVEAGPLNTSDCGGE